MAYWLLLVPAGLYLSYGTYASLRVLRALPPLPHAGERADWPKVSMIVPACNEADTLREATKSKLALDYPNLEIVIVDDRSTDDTGRIADEIAATDARVTVVHVKELPEGWLGKVHAMHLGAKAASGEHLLLSDADVHMAKDLLRRTIDAVEREKLDFVALFPEVWSSGFFIDTAMNVMVRLLVTLGRLWKVSDPRSHVAPGSGVFNLARRSVFEKTEGFAWLKMEVIDDIGVAQLMKRAGGKCALYNARDALALYFYRSVGEMMRGMEKNGYSAFGQLHLGRALGLFVMFALIELGPVIALALPSAPLPVKQAAGALLVGAVMLQVALARWGGRSMVPALVPCVGAVLFVGCMMRAVILTEVHGGVQWRGTRYTLKQLREGARVKP